MPLGIFLFRWPTYGKWWQSAYGFSLWAQLAGCRTERGICCTGVAAHFWGCSPFSLMGRLPWGVRVFWRWSLIWWYCSRRLRGRGEKTHHHTKTVKYLYREWWQALWRWKEKSSLQVGSACAHSLQVEEVALQLLSLQINLHEVASGSSLPSYTLTRHVATRIGGRGCIGTSSPVVLSKISAIFS